MPAPICVSCQGFYRPEKNGFPFIEGMPAHDMCDTVTQPAKERDGWKPYKIWVGDKWKCPGCGHEIIVDALRPASEHYMTGFAQYMEWAKASGAITVNDCC